MNALFFVTSKSVLYPSSRLSCRLIVPSWRFSSSMRLATDPMDPFQHITSTVWLQQSEYQVVILTIHSCVWIILIHSRYVAIVDLFLICCWYTSPLAVWTRGPVDLSRLNSGSKASVPEGSAVWCIRKLALKLAPGLLSEVCHKNALCHGSHLPVYSVHVFPKYYRWFLSSSNAMGCCGLLLLPVFIAQYSFNLLMELSTIYITIELNA